MDYCGGQEVAVKSFEGKWYKGYYESYDKEHDLHKVTLTKYDWWIVTSDRIKHLSGDKGGEERTKANVS